MAAADPGPQTRAPSDSRGIGGASAIIAACILWPSAYCIRKDYLAELSPFTMMFLTSTAISVVFSLAMPRTAAAALLTLGRMPLRCIGVSVSGVVLGSTLFYFALDRLDVGVAGVLEKLQPVFVIFLGVLFLKEPFPLRKLPWVALALCSSYLVSQRNPLSASFAEASTQGMVFAMLAAACYSLASTFGRSVLKAGVAPVEVALLRFMVAAPCYIPILWLTGDLAALPSLRIEAVAVVSLAAVFLTGGGYLLYYRGLRDMPAASASLIELSSSVAAVALGIAIRGEQPTFHQLAASLVLLFAIRRIAV